MSLELGSVVVTKGQIWLQTLLLVLLGSHVEGKQVVLQQLLLHDFVKDGNHTGLGKGLVAHSNNDLEVLAGEDVLLLLDVAELLVLDEQLSIALSTSADSEVVNNEVTLETSRSKLNPGSLRCFLVGAAL